MPHFTTSVSDSPESMWLLKPHLTLSSRIFHFSSEIWGRNIDIFFSWGGVTKIITSFTTNHILQFFLTKYGSNNFNCNFDCRCSLKDYQGETKIEYFQFQLVTSALVFWMNGQCWLMECWWLSRSSQLSNNPRNGGSNPNKVDSTLNGSPILVCVSLCIYGYS